MEKRANTDFIFKAIDLDQPIDPDFDLEAWLADLLVAYWLSQNGGDDAS